MPGELGHSLRILALGDEHHRPATGAATRRATAAKGISRHSAAVGLVEDAGIVLELTGQEQNRIYSYRAYVEFLSR